MNKEQTLTGVHSGERLYLGRMDGRIIQAVVWDRMLLLQRNRLPHQLIHQWRGRYIVGGRFWLPVPHAFVKNPLNLMLYEDSLLSSITWLFRETIRDHPSVWFRLWREHG